MTALGPQPAPDDYRIANRPGNPNWRGVSDWFDRAAGVTPMTAQPAPTMREAIADLLTYRKQAGALNFQLEKADEYMRRLDAALANDTTPELLAVAQAVIDYECGLKGGLSDCVKLARAALAKARGEA